MTCSSSSTLTASRCRSEGAREAEGCERCQVSLALLCQDTTHTGLRMQAPFRQIVQFYLPPPGCGPVELARNSWLLG
eukprot:10341787-Alexandrium_andersonii.AAC.1